MKFSFEIQKTDMGVIIKPIYSSDAEELAKLKQNTRYRVDIKQDRNNKFTRKCFALARLGYDNQERFNNFRAYRKNLTIKAGFFESYEINESIAMIADSWAESETDQIKMEEIFKGILGVLSYELDTAPELIKEQLEHYM